MIVSFKDKATQAVFAGKVLKGFPAQIATVARRRLRMLNAASALDDLRAPPANHLEALQRDRAGQHSIRVNDQWRICFVWTPEGPRDVEICDYH